MEATLEQRYHQETWSHHQEARPDHRERLDHEDRPWGSWYVVAVGSGYKVKTIHVRPGCRLSYQTHRYRSEHWVVISGIATCIIDGVEATVRPGESVDVPVGARHRLGNDAGETLVIVEVQRGPYTGEDDIERLQDDYGRCPAP